MGVIDEQGTIIVPIRYSYCSVLSESTCLIVNGGRMYFMNQSFYTKEDQIEVRMYNSHDRYLVGGKYGVYYKGNEIIPPIYDKIIPNKDETLFIVKKENKYGLIDSMGKILINVEWENLSIIA